VRTVFTYVHGPNSCIQAVSQLWIPDKTNTQDLLETALQTIPDILFKIRYQDLTYVDYFAKVNPNPNPNPNLSFLLFSLFSFFFFVFVISIYLTLSLFICFI